MRLSKSLFFFLLIQCTYFNAQEIEGYVITASTGLPLSNVNIIQKKSKKGATTNINGKFVLELNLDPNDTLVFSHVSYSSKYITLKALEELNYEVVLTQKAQELSEVNIVSDKRRTLRNTLQFQTLSSLKKGMHSFATIALKDSILVIGGDESFEEDQIKKRMVRDPTLDLKGIMESAAGDLTWRHYSGKIQVYDIATNKWKISSIEVRNRAYHNVHLYQNKLYIFGGKRLVQRGKFEYLDHTIEVVDLKTGLIQVDNTNPHQASSSSSYIKGNNLIVAGGAIKEDKQERKTYVERLHEYNFESGYWYEIGLLPEKGNIRGALVENHFYTLIWNKFSKGELYSNDLDTGHWTRELTTTIEFESPAITSVDDSIYIFENNKFFVFNSKTKTFKEYKINLKIKGAKIIATNDEMFIIGGFRENEYSKKPSSGFYRISMAEFEKTTYKQLNIIDN